MQVTIYIYISAFWHLKTGFDWANIYGRFSSGVYLAFAVFRTCLTCFFGMVLKISQEVHRLLSQGGNTVSYTLASYREVKKFVMVNLLLYGSLPW